MRQTIELLRKQSIQAGLTQAHMQSMGVQVNGNGTSKGNSSPTKTNGHDQEQQNQQQPQQQSQQMNGNMQRQRSSDSMCSVNSNGSNGSSSHEKGKKKKGWVCQINFKKISINLFSYFLSNSFEVHLPKLFHVMPKFQRQIAKRIYCLQIIPI